MEEDRTILTPGAQSIPVGGGPGSAIKAPKAKLLCLDDSMLPAQCKGIKISLDGNEQTVGRSADNTVPIPFQKISGKHARIFPEGGQWKIEDLKSTNGVWINDVRVESSFMRSGDYVKIGSVPFQFILEQPELEAFTSEDAQASGATIMFGSIGAAEALMQAEATQETEEKEVRKEQPSRKPSASGGGAVRAAAAHGGGGGGKGGLFAGIGVGVAVLAVAGWFFLGGSGQEEAVHNNQKAIGQFTSDFEVSAGRFSKKGLQEEMAKLDPIGVSLAEATQKFPKSKELADLEARYLFLRFERDLRGLVEANQASKALALVEEILAKLKPIQERAAGSENVAQVVDLVAMARNVALLKQFREKYSKPAQGGDMPPPELMEQMAQVRRDFVSEKKNPRINTALSVTYAYFGRMVDEVDQYDLILLDTWKGMISNQGGAPAPVAAPQ